MILPDHPCYGSNAKTQCAQLIPLHAPLIPLPQTLQIHIFPRHHSTIIQHCCHLLPDNVHNLHPLLWDLVQYQYLACMIQYFKEYEWRTGIFGSLGSGPDREFGDGWWYTNHFSPSNPPSAPLSTSLSAQPSAPTSAQPSTLPYTSPFAQPST